jgi:murein DD-endopeptidase MepM/ murein hydrolase activator NlpD
MIRTKYRYNEKSLRFERAGISILNVSMSILALLCFGAVFFLGLFFLQNYLINTPAEKALRKENQALMDHKVVLTAKLESAEGNLASLKKSEEELYSKFFDLAMERDASVKNKDILLADLPVFHTTVQTLQEKFKGYYLRANASNNHFSLYASVTKKDLPQITSFPGAFPVEDIEPKMLVSGFGTRINPWHKGKYHHDGVDIAGARGSRVLATGKGRVISVKKSDLQAGFGNYVEIDHGHGFVTRYTHLGDLTVRLGQSIKKGEQIAWMGLSGGSIAPHVHYEVLKDGKNIDPVKVMVEGITSNQFSLLAVAGRQLNQSLD